MKYTYKTKGTCSNRIELEVEDDKIKSVQFYGGCDANLEAISRLIKRVSVHDIISRLEGIPCGPRPTSCPDQLCQALHEMGY